METRHWLGLLYLVAWTAFLIGAAYAGSLRRLLRALEADDAGGYLPDCCEDCGNAMISARTHKCELCGHSF